MSLDKVKKKLKEMKQMMMIVISKKSIDFVNLLNFMVNKISHKILG